MSDKAVYYPDYLQLDKILNAQTLESDLRGAHAHDEMLFIIIHQAYELWFKQLLFEADSVAAILEKDVINDNSPDLQIAVHRMNRMIEILKVAVHQIDILETMTAMDFLDFRDFLRPASGFQSIQFKILEARLGLRFSERHAQHYYLSQLRPEHAETVKTAEQKPSILDLVNDWLERMPFFDEERYWKNYNRAFPLKKSHYHPFWSDYRKLYENSLGDIEVANLRHFSKLFFEKEKSEDRRLSARACRAALFIKLYRGQPMLQVPYQLLSYLLEIDTQLSTWRYRHIHMVQKMIGSRTGTGGSTGKGYLKGALDAHHIFKEIAELTSYLIERRNLPELSPELQERFGY